MSAEFVHLHVHTQFSFLVSTVKLAELPARTKELGMSAVALTDRANMYGAIRHWKKCKAIGVRPILGAEVNVAREGGKGVVDHLVLLASNDAGYRNLIDLVSLGYREPASDAGASIRLEDIATRRSGLVGLSGFRNGV